MIDPPRTVKAAEHYRYDGGAPYDQTLCAYQIRLRGQQCSRQPCDGPSILYCNQHARIVARKGA